MARFEDCINDPEIFRLLLEGFLAKWDGVFDVMVAEPTPNYLYKPRPGDTAFCRRIRKSEQGDRLCFECDKEHLEIARRSQVPESYLCHAGLVDISVPLIVDDELIAVILCGQCRSDDPELEDKGRHMTAATAERLDIPPDELQQLRTETRVVSTEEIESVKDRLSKVTNWTARIGHERLELQSNRREYLRESQLLQTILATLTAVEVDEFWGKLDDALEKICDTIGADHAALLISEDGEPVEAYALKSTARLRKVDFLESYLPSKLPMTAHADSRSAHVLDFDAPSGSFCAHLMSATGRRPEKVMQIPFKLSGDCSAMMLFFVSSERDLATSLPIERETDLLAQMTRQVATAFENCVLYTTQREVSREKDVFLEDIAHQLITPLAGIQANCDRLWRHLGDWDESLIASRVSSIRGISRCAALLTRNLVWVATRNGHAIAKLEPEQITPLLIGCAMDVQGTAAYKGIRVHVDEPSADLLPRIAVDRHRISQVIVNLLDNAVKYADRGTEVVISAAVQDGWALVFVSDHGAVLRKEDVTRIFERGYRTEEAKRKVPGGTGIGLFVAREIALLHGGDLSAEPSVYDPVPRKHKVVFTLKLKMP